SANDVTTIAASHSGTISYRDVSGLAVGTVTDTALTSTTTSGMTDNADVRLARRSDVKDKNRGGGRSGGDLTLNVPGTVAQTAALSATGLQLLGAGAVTLDNSANDVTMIAANHSGTISYRDANTLAVGTVTDTALPTTTTSGITDNADVR